MWPNPQIPADLVKFTEEILNGNGQRPSITQKYVIELSSSFIGKTIPGNSINSTSFLKIFCKEILIIKEEFEEINSINYSSMPRYIWMFLVVL